MSESRNDRLAHDFREMLKIQNRPYLSWIAAKGDPPYTEEYLLSIKLRTYVLSISSGRYTVGAVHRCVVWVRLWDSYPQVAPCVRMLDLPPIFHPDWYSKGAYSPSTSWDPKMSLKDYVLRMLKTIQYDPELMDLAAPANYKAANWFRRSCDKGWFPSDSTELTENSPEEIAAAEKAALTFDELIDDESVR